MTRNFILLAFVALTALGTNTLAATKEVYEDSTRIEKDANGNYKEKDVTIKTDASGTTTTSEVNSDIQVGTNGETVKNTTTKDVIDPPGLANRKVINTSNTEQVKDGMVKSSHRVTVNGKTVENETTTSPVEPSSQ